MEQIVIIKADGTEIPLFSRKNASCVSKATQKIALLSEDIVSISLTSAVPLDLGIGDNILLYGKPYKLNQLTEPTKEGERRYTYDLKLEGLQYDLIDVHYHLPEDAYGETYYSDLAGHLQVLMWNINRIYPGKWILGAYPTETEYKNITNSGKNCLQVAQELCSDYGVEFEITTDGKRYTINFKEKVGITHAFTLKYGRGLGLYKLQRKNVNNSSVITRLYVYGSTENLGNNYGHTRLCLPDTKRLTSYLEDANAIAIYGIKEGEKGYDNIKPQRVGTVTALGKDVITFVDNTMFDLNAKAEDGKSTKYLIDGTTAKIKFESGGLAGYEFDLHSYDHATKTFVINKFQDESGLVFPSETSSAFRIEVGDKYSISDIQLPDNFIYEAEKKLKEEGSKYLSTVSQPQVSYKLELTDGFFIKLWGKDIETEVLHVGDFIKVEDEQIGVNKAVRITQIERDLLKPHSYDITLSDTVTKTTTVRVWNELQDISEVIKINKLADPTKARRRWMATQELLNMVFDPEGDYYSEKIKPLSIETQMLSVGAKSTQFTLQNIMFQPNYGGDANTLYVSNGTLVHYAIEPDGLKYWTLEGATFSGLTPETAFYIYARCQINGDVGNIILTEAARTVDEESGYYNFLVGVLNSVVTDADGKNPGRLVSLTYGSSTINGRFIRTGRIESSGGGTCYFDLDNDEIGGKIKFTSGSSGLGNLSEWDEVDNRISAAQEAADAAQEAADKADENAESALKEIKDMASDNILSPVEKTQVMNDWEAIQGEFNKNVNAATAAGIDSTEYKTAFSILSSYLIPLLTDLTEESEISGNTFRTRFKTYYDARTDLLNAIARAARDAADAAQESANNAAELAQDAKDSAENAKSEVNELNEYIDGAFADGIITEAEAKAIEKYLNTVNNTKAAIEATYNKLVANTYLSGTAKTNLVNAKVTLLGAIDNLIASINTAISDGKTTTAEKNDVDSKFSAFNTAYADFNGAVEDANKAIQDALKGYSDEAVNELNEYIDGAFADGIITEAEAKAIEKYLNTVNNTKAAIEATYNKLVANTYLSGTAKTNLVNAKVTLLGAIDNLIASINTAISDGKTTTAEKNDVDSKFSAFNTAYADFNGAVEDANKAIQDALKGYSDEAVNELNEYIDGAFADGIITEAEAKAIEKYLNTVNNTKAAIEATYNKLVANTYLSGTAKTNLVNAKVTLLGAIDNLIASINTAISDGKTTTAEKNDVDSKFSAFNTAYADFNGAVEDANKAIQDALKGYSDEAVNELNEYIDGAFADGIITEAEAKAIEKYLNTVNNTKAAIEATYNKLVANTYLSGTAKTNLVNAKVTLLGAIDNLIASINTAISDGKTTTAEKNDVDSKFSAFNTAYADFNGAVEDANKAIQDALKGYSDEAVNELNRFIDVDFNALKESALKKDTIIEGGYIRTSLINVDDIFVKHLYGADGTFTSLSTTGEPTASKLGVHIGEEAFSQLTEATGAATLTKGTSHEVKIETVNDSGWQEFMLCSATAKEPCAVQLDWNVDVQLAGRGYGDGSYGQLVTYKKGSAQILMRYYIENVETQDYVCNTIVSAPIQPDGIGGASQNAVTLDFTPSGSFVAILQAGQTMRITAVMRALGESFGSLGGNPSAWVKMQVPSVTMTVSRSIAALCSEGLGLVKSSAERILIKPTDIQTGSSGYTVRGGMWKFENEMIALNAHVSIVGSISSEQNADAAWWISAGVIIFTGESGTRFTMPLSTITSTVNHIRFVIWNAGVKITEQGTNGMFGLPNTSTAVREWTTQRPGCLYEAIYVKELGYWCFQGA